MARIAYDREDAEAFEATRHLAADGLTAWRAAVARHLDHGADVRLVDIGAGTGAWARAFTDWYEGIEVIAVEPAAAMRARCRHPHVLAGAAADIPLADASVDGAWLSTVVHHVPDLAAAAREVRRVVRHTHPSVAEVEAAFATAGFVTVALEQVPQTTAQSLGEFAANVRREAHTPLQLLSDEEYADGLARLRAAAGAERGPVIDVMDLLVLR